MGSFCVFIFGLLKIFIAQAIRVNESSTRMGSESHDQIILQQLLRDYDQRVRPPPTNISRKFFV